ncbi:DNA repair protein RadA [Anaeropeptidivorans aminofermentans]|jgi:DNA repair protein RadA/Sms|uniref:DNA repair protein RadA n=1 Tax=Anaeropeptidivorans aminofermentans TaxID=2934315 RepID=UPI00202598B1|nr:DNA repair protein RadA [Anaeropeptidivorans aminofermentans]MBE6011915.1 DNA repair protein RadA [Lachnospiraceae bacterium]
MAKQKSVYICTNCGYETGKWLGRCTQCGEFNTFEESIPEVSRYGSKEKGKRFSGGKGALKLSDISSMEDKKLSTKINELDRVLSGGIVEGSLMLIGGDPGIGKSTIILQISQTIGEQGKTVLYVSGEESAKQIKLRAGRLSIDTENLLIMSETNLEAINEAVNSINPDFLIIDSIQTIYSGDIASAPGSVTQVRECTSHFMHISKVKGISTIIVGHVTKDGAIAGPKILEHMVDTVLYFEGDKLASYRLIRAVKNRFGATNEIGVFEMRKEGLAEIANPSEYMLTGRPINAPGSVITCSVEGTRPILAEVQALVSKTSFGVPRRTSTGVDYNRVAMLMAVLEKRRGMQLSAYDSYVNIAGGMKITEPAVDAAIIAAIASSYRNIPVAYDTLIFGEVGLTGEMRAVSNAQTRIAEASKLGFKTCIMPKANTKGIKNTENIQVYGISNIIELLEIACPK